MILNCFSIDRNESSLLERRNRRTYDIARNQGSITTRMRDDDGVYTGCFAQDAVTGCGVCCRPDDTVDIGWFKDGALDGCDCLEACGVRAARAHREREVA